MRVFDIAARSLLEEELEAVTETGLYDSKEAFLAHAVEVLLTARPDLREAVACKLYEKGVLSLGRTAEFAGISIEDLKEELHRRGISRESNESLEEMEEMARMSLRMAGRAGHSTAGESQPRASSRSRSSASKGKTL